MCDEAWKPDGQGQLFNVGKQLFPGFAQGEFVFFGLTERPFRDYL